MVIVITLLIIIKQYLNNQLLYEITMIYTKQRETQVMHTVINRIEMWTMREWIQVYISILLFTSII